MRFEEVVLKGLASDGGLFIPEEIPALPTDWASRWKDLSFAPLAFEILSLYISADELPSQDLQNLLHASYGTFRNPETTPLVTLDPSQNLHVLELFHGPTFAFKDVALQFLGNLFEYFLTRRNCGKNGTDRHHLTVVGATSGDTGSAAIYGLRQKKDISIFMLHPKGRVSPIQEAQMTTVLDANVHNLAIEGTFDDCQNMVKAMFADAKINKEHNLGAVNSINWARILAQITYYFHAYFSLTRRNNLPLEAKLRFVVPTGNFGDVLAGYFAKRMGLPMEKLVIATNENDILDRFWKSGSYEMKSVHGKQAEGGLADDGVKAHVAGVRETLSPAMDILVSSNFERLLWFLSFQEQKGEIEARRHAAGVQVKQWLTELKSAGGFTVPSSILQAARVDFESERISDAITLETIRHYFTSRPPLQTSGNPSNSHHPAASGKPGYILDPHSAIGIAASNRSMARTSTDDTHHISLATAHPAKFASAVQLALNGLDGFNFEEDVLPKEFEGLMEKERRLQVVANSSGLEEMRVLIRKGVESEVNVAA